MELLDNMYEKLNENTSNDTGTLNVIVNSIQELERLHPFKDGNCRTFCMVLLNVFLMQYGFPPTLMDDPNKFDGFSVDELVFLVKEGIERTNELCAYVKGQDLSKKSISDSLIENIYENWMDIDADQETMLSHFANELTNNLLKLNADLDKSVQTQKSIKGEVQILKEIEEPGNSKRLG